MQQHKWWFHGLDKVDDVEAWRPYPDIQGLESENSDEIKFEMR